MRWSALTEPEFTEFFSERWRVQMKPNLNQKMAKRRKRRTLTAQFKFQVALEAVRGIKSIHEIAAEHEVHPSQVTTWKKELVGAGSSLFERKNARNEERDELEERTEELERTLGRVVVEKEFLVKKCKQLGIEP